MRAIINKVEDSKVIKKDMKSKLSNKKKVIVHVGNPKTVLKNIKYASTYACVPKYKAITKENQPLAEFPAERLAEPIDFYPRSYSSWKKKIKLKI